MTEYEQQLLKLKIEYGFNFAISKIIDSGKIITIFFENKPEKDIVNSRKILEFEGMVYSTNSENYHFITPEMGVVCLKELILEE